MVKRLKFNDLGISAFQDIDNPLGILSANNEDEGFLHNNFVNIYGTRETDVNNSWLELKFPAFRYIERNWFLEYGNIDRVVMLDKWDTITSFLIDYIDMGWHSNFLIDAFYLSPYRSNFKKNHYIHDIFVHGYDPEKKIFYVADFFNNGRFSMETISFAEMEDGFNSFIKIDANNHLNGVDYVAENSDTAWYTSWYMKLVDCDLKEGIRGLRFKGKQEYFDFELFKLKFKDYYLSENTVDSYHVNRIYREKKAVFGISTYASILEDLENCIDKNISVYVKNGYLFYLHKKMRGMAVKYLLDNSYIKESHHSTIAEIGDIEQKCLKAMHLIIKFSITAGYNRSNKKILKRIIDIYQSCYEREKRIIPVMLDQFG